MLGIGSGSFDPETLVILETAFDEAWITLKSSAAAMACSCKRRRAGVRRRARADVRK
jgi:hypothetical protein